MEDESIESGDIQGYTCTVKVTLHKKILKLMGRVLDFQCIPEWKNYFRMTSTIAGFTLVYDTALPL